jgi:hypothetical protein
MTEKSDSISFFCVGWRKLHRLFSLPRVKLRKTKKEVSVVAEKKKRARGKRRGFLVFFLLSALLLSGTLGILLALTADLSPEHDEALFLGAGADTQTHFYYREGEEEGAWREWE